MATVGAGTTGSNTGSAWATEQRSVATDKSLSEFPLQRYTLLTTNTLRVDPLSFETVALRESLSDTLPELEAFEVNDLLMVTQALTAVRTNCEDLKSTAVSTEWLPVTLVPGSMSDGLFGLRHTIPTPESPCNCFSLAALHARRCGNWRALKMSETLFPDCKRPHCSYTRIAYNCYNKATQETVEILTGALFKADVVSAAQTTQTMCFCCSLSTAREIMETGEIPISLFTNGQLNCWFTPRGALLRTLQMHWAGIGTELDEKVTVLCWNPSLDRFLTSATVHQLTTNFTDESQTVEALTAFNRLYLDHCWTTGALEGNNVHLDKMECRSGFGILLPFTARELIEPLQSELNCNQLFGMHCRGLAGHCILTVGQLELTYEDVYTDCTWRSLYTNDSLPLKMKKKRNFKIQDDTDHTELTGKVNVEITGLPISTDGVTFTITGSN